MTTKAVAGIHFRGLNQIIFFWGGVNPQTLSLIHGVDNNLTFNNCSTYNN